MTQNLIWYVSAHWASKDLDGIRAVLFDAGKSVKTSAKFRTLHEARQWAETEGRIWTTPAPKEPPPGPRTAWERILDDD